MDDVVDDDTLATDLEDAHSVANVRFSAAQLVARSPDLSAFFPFAFVAPEHIHRRRVQRSELNPQQVVRDTSVRRKRFSITWGSSGDGIVPTQTQEGDNSSNNRNIEGDDDGDVSMIVSPVSPAVSLLPLPFRRRSMFTSKNSNDGSTFVLEPSLPENLKGVFVRKYRWGCIDVLDPEHCDFAALRTAMFTTHLKVRT
jgi:hypothetical protein